MPVVTDSLPVARAGRAYGAIVYWGTLVGTVIALAGLAVSFTTPHHYADPNRLLAGVWSGDSVEAIWAAAERPQPSGHWYLLHLDAGDGWMTLGLALGVFTVIPGILAASAILGWYHRAPFYAGLGVSAAAITGVAMTGWL
jgi:hypothetical protein